MVCRSASATPRLLPWLYLLTPTRKTRCLQLEGTRAILSLGVDLSGFQTITSQGSSQFRRTVLLILQPRGSWMGTRATLHL